MMCKQVSPVIYFASGFAPSFNKRSKLALNCSIAATNIGVLWELSQASVSAPQSIN